jgi:beta-glucanase (GH16 family)
MYMLANLAVGGNWPGNPDASTHFPAVMTVDFIRAYRFGP